MTNFQTAVRQADFMLKLCKLFREFDASIRIDHQRDDCGGPVLEISACGNWIPFYECTWFDLDECIKATQATIDHATALENA